MTRVMVSLRKKKWMRQAALEEEDRMMGRYHRESRKRWTTWFSAHFTSVCLDVGAIFWNVAAVWTITLKLFLLKCSSCFMYMSYTSSSSRSDSLVPTCRNSMEAVVRQTFLRDFVSTLPLSTQISSVPLLSLRTHPTSFPFSNSSWDMGGKGTWRILKLNLGMVCCLPQGRKLPIAPTGPEFPFLCFLQPHPGILQTSKGLLV